MIQASPFFMLSAPVLGSTSVCSTSGLGYLALHFPCLLIQVGLSFFGVFSFFVDWFLPQSCTLDRSIRSSTVYLKLSHQFSSFLQSQQCSQLPFLQNLGGGSDNV